MPRSSRVPSPPIVPVIAEAASLLSAIPVGLLADKFSRRLLIAIGMGLMTVSAVLNIVPAGVIVVHSAYSQGERVLEIRDDRKVGVVGHQVVSD